MRVVTFMKSFFSHFNMGQTSTFAASLAYYTALSLAPLLILSIAITSKLPGKLQENFITQIHGFIGPEAAEGFELVLQNARERSDLASASGVFGILTLLFSASLIFGELKSALNYILFKENHEIKKGTNLEIILLFLKSKFLQIGLALSFILIMIVSLTISSIISAPFSGYKEIYRFLNIGISFLFYVGTFSLLFRYLPDKKILWRHSLCGGFITALLFVLGKELIGFYLGNSAIGSAYGAAGSLIVLLVWVYYTSLITFVGAHVSALLIWKEEHYETAS